MMQTSLYLGGWGTLASSHVFVGSGSSLTAAAVAEKGCFVVAVVVVCSLDTFLCSSLAFGGSCPRVLGTGFDLVMHSHHHY